MRRCWKMPSSHLLTDRHSRAQVAALLAERISLTGDMALFSLEFNSMRRGYALSFSLGYQILMLPKSSCLVIKFHVCQTLGAYTEAVVMLANRACPAVYAIRAASAYISATQGKGDIQRHGTSSSSLQSKGVRVACRARLSV